MDGAAVSAWWALLIPIVGALATFALDLLARRRARNRSR
jgi:hypothetical protein